MQKNILFNNGVLSFEENYIPFFLPKNNNVQKICGVPPCPSLLEKHPMDILPKSIMPNTSKRLLALTKILHPPKKKTFLRFVMETAVYDKYKVPEFRKGEIAR